MDNDDGAEDQGWACKELMIKGEHQGAEDHEWSP